MSFLSASSEAKTSGAWTGAGAASSSGSGEWQGRILALNVSVAMPRIKKKKGKLFWVGVKVRGHPGLTPHPHLHQITREVGSGQRPSPGLDKKLLPLVLH